MFQMQQVFYNKYLNSFLTVISRILNTIGMATKIEEEKFTNISVTSYTFEIYCRKWEFFL